MEGREQYVEIINNKAEIFQSKCKEVKYGVPQGSVLGPLFFTLYINDLPKYIADEADIVMFADDCALVIPDKDRSALEEKNCKGCKIIAKLV